MIRALLNIIGLKQGDIVFEPFSGSVTTALEAQLLGINFYGIDISPLCVIQGRVKTESIFVLDKILEIKERLGLKLREVKFEFGANEKSVMHNSSYNTHNWFIEKKEKN